MGLSKRNEYKFKASKIRFLRISELHQARKGTSKLALVFENINREKQIQFFASEENI